MPNPKTVIVRNPVDAITVVPHMIGFHPEDSLVIVHLGTPALALRVDHPHTPEDMLSVIRSITPARPHFEGGKNLIVCYTDDAEIAQATVDILADYIPNALPPLRVHEGMYWERTFDGPGTRFIASDIGIDPLEVAPDREAVCDTAAPQTPTDAFVELFDAAAHRVVSAGFDRRAEAEWIVERLLAPQELFSDTDLARISAAMVITHLRDVAISCATNLHLALWKDAVRRCGPNAAVRTVFAFTAWLAGDGALAWKGIELTREVDPDDSMARLTAVALQAAVNPKTWDPPALTDLPVFQ